MYRHLYSHLLIGVQTQTTLNNPENNVAHSSQQVKRQQELRQESITIIDISVLRISSMLKFKN